jgi:ketosteroid isomerase-like protein
MIVGTAISLRKFSALSRFLIYAKSQPAAPGARPEFNVRKLSWPGAILLLPLFIANAQHANAQQTSSDEGGRILALEKVWNHALEEKNARALDMLLASTFVSVDIDGSTQSKTEFLASIRDPDYQPSQVVTEQSTVQVHGDVAVVVGVYHVKGTEKRKAYLRRSRFVDTWAKVDGTWQCLASSAVVLTAK